MKNQIKEAIAASKKAYAPYSKFNVGAALELKDGTIIHGANIENGSYGLSSCAERNALFSLISQGYDKADIVSITVTGNTKEPISPCGACRQVMSELLPKGTPVFLTNLEGKVKKMTIDELLPYGFDLDEDSK
ncbi:MAG: cytidine deaminase [Candidatus Phytoplasma sp.]|nr:cytidine deaminase [Phytoplasma sp.]